MEFVAPPLISTAVDAHIVDICMVDSFVPFVDRLSQSTRLCGSAWSAPAERAMMDSNVCNRDADIQVVRCFVALTWLAGTGWRNILAFTWWTVPVDNKKNSTTPMPGLSWWMSGSPSDAASRLTSANASSSFVMQSTTGYYCTNSWVFSSLHQRQYPGETRHEWRRVFRILRSTPKCDWHHLSRKPVSTFLPRKARTGV